MSHERSRYSREKSLEEVYAETWDEREKVFHVDQVCGSSCILFVVTDPATGTVEGQDSRGKRQRSASGFCSARY